jgi:hypothetical protein
LGRSEDSVLIARGSPLATNALGQYFAVSFDWRRVLVFDADGRLERALGQPGGGPGEFNSRISDVVIHMDSVFVFTQDRRLAVFSPSLRLARSAALSLRSPHPPLVVGPRSEIIVAASVPTRNASGLDFHVMDRVGRHTLSFGNETIVVPGSVTSASAPTLQGVPPPIVGAPAMDRVWTVDSDYQITSWSVLGKKSASFRVADVPWIVNRPPMPSIQQLRDELNASRAAIEAGMPQPPSRTPPRSNVHIVDVDSSGRLFFLANVNFHESRRPTSGPLAVCPALRSERSPGWMACSFVEVVDTRQVVLLLSQSVGTGLQFVAGRNLAFRYVEGADGITTIRIERMRLVIP